MARDQAIAPTIFAGVRLRESTFVYDDDPDSEHPGRLLRTISSPDYVAEDHALLLGLETYEKSLCSNCGWPRHLAWHSDMDGWFEGHTVKCQACTAMSTDPTKPVLYHFTTDTRPVDESGGHEPLSPFVLGLTTSPS
jgi:hypothetical protein